MERVVVPQIPNRFLLNNNRTIKWIIKGNKISRQANRSNKWGWGISREWGDRGTWTCNQLLCKCNQVLARMGNNSSNNSFLMKRTRLLCRSKLFTEVVKPDKNLKERKRWSLLTPSLWIDWTNYSNKLYKNVMDN